MSRGRNEGWDVHDLTREGGKGGGVRAYAHVCDLLGSRTWLNKHGLRGGGGVACNKGRRRGVGTVLFVALHDSRYALERRRTMIWPRPPHLDWVLSAMKPSMRSSDGMVNVALYPHVCPPSVQPV
jgi:hypothetical protein